MRSVLKINLISAVKDVLVDLLLQTSLLVPGHQVIYYRHEGLVNTFYD